MKTLNDWRNDERNRNLDDFLRINDIVDDNMVNYFRDLLPPRYNSTTLLQVGEPYSSAKTETGDYKDTYSTFHKENGNWVYKGVCFACETINRDLQHEFTKAERFLVGVYDDIHEKDPEYVRLTYHSHDTYFITGNMSDLKTVESRLNTALGDINLSREDLNNDIRYENSKYMRSDVISRLKISNENINSFFNSTIVARYIEFDNNINIIAKTPEGHYFNYYGCDIQNEMYSSNSGGYNTLGEAKAMMLKHRSTSVEISEKEENSIAIKYYDITYLYKEPDKYNSIIIQSDSKEKAEQYVKNKGRIVCGITEKTDISEDKRKGKPVIKLSDKSMIERKNHAPER